MQVQVSAASLLPTEIYFWLCPNNCLVIFSLQAKKLSQDSSMRKLQAEWMLIAIWKGGQSFFDDFKNYLYEPSENQSVYLYRLPCFVRISPQ